MNFRSGAPHGRTQSRKLVAIAAAILIATSGTVVALATANSALAGGGSSDYWSGKSDNVSQPSDGVITVSNPESTDVALNDQITLDVSATCTGPYFGENNASIVFTIGEAATELTGSWAAAVEPTPTESPTVEPTPTIAPGIVENNPTDDGAYIFTGTVQFTITASPVTLHVSGGGATCFGNETFTEEVATFTVPLVCPTYPGVLYNEGGHDVYAVTDQNNSYTQNWETEQNGSVDDQVADAVGGSDVGFQADAFDGFGENLFRGTSSGTEINMYNECTTFDEANGTYYSNSMSNDGELSYSTTTKYFSTADTARRTYIVTNKTANASAAQAVTVYNNLGSDSNTSEYSATAYGETTNDDGNGDPIVTQLWGGPTTAVVNGALFPSAPIAASYDKANARSAAWLNAAALLPSSYFAGLDTATVLNWGAAAVTPQVSADQDDFYITYEVPALAPGQSVNIVQFAHVQLFSEDHTTVGQLPWVDRALDNGALGDAYTSSVTAPNDDTTYSSYVATGLPAGLSIDNEGHVTGIPTVAGDYSATITATNADSYAQIATAVTLSISGPPAPTIALQLNFIVGTSIADANTTASAHDLLVGSSWTLDLFSTQRQIASGVVGDAGTISQRVNLPTDLEPGAHRLLLSGIAADHTEVTSQAWFTLGANGKILALSLTGPTPPMLAVTGTDSSGLVTIGGLAALVGLMLLVGVGMRRSRRANIA